VDRGATLTLSASAVDVPGHTLTYELTYTNGRHRYECVADRRHAGIRCLFQRLGPDDCSTFCAELGIHADAAALRV
jgi:hypothetical protein